MLLIDFISGTSLVREADRRSDLPMVRNGPPGTFVIVPDGVRVSLPTDQIVRADETGGRVSVAFGGMIFAGHEAGQLTFQRMFELRPEAELSPDRSHTMRLDPHWVERVHMHGRQVWTSIVYKIVPAALWRQGEASGRFTGSPVDERDGFIHFSTAAQVHETAARHFSGAADLLLVAVSASGLDLKWEPSRGGDLFPHLYGPLPLTAVRWVRPLPLGDNGRHLFPLLDA
jgi:uncharacterized protein (DUF952 family)